MIQKLDAILAIYNSPSQQAKSPPRTVTLNHVIVATVGMNQPSKHMT